MPPRTRLVILLAGQAALRSGEARALRQGDIDFKTGTITIKHTLVREFRDGTYFLEDAKTKAGDRVVAMPPQVAEAVKAHLKQFVGPGKDALLFPGSQNLGNLPEATYQTVQGSPQTGQTPPIPPALV